MDDQSLVSRKSIIVQNKNSIIYITIDSFKTKEYPSFEYMPTKNHSTKKYIYIFNIYLFKKTF